MTELSLAIPVYNSGRFLDELFNCLRALDPLPAEIVFLDDASTDDSLTLLQGFATSKTVNTAVRILRNEHNIGVAGAYNRLAREAHCDFVQVLDADDLLANFDYYSSVGIALRADVDVVVTGLRSNARLLDAASRALGRIVPRRPPTWWPLLGSFATRAGVIYRRRLLLETPFPDPAWPGSDIVHLLRLRKTNSCVFLPHPCVLYRIHRNAQSSQQRDYDNYRKALTEFNRTTRTAHRLDLDLRCIGQRWMR